MSYQFEDDSALEELLNQQLDRRRQQQTSNVASTSKVIEAQEQKRGSNSISKGVTRPSTASVIKQTIQPTTELLSAGSSSIKMADWLGSKGSGRAMSITEPDENKTLEENLKEERLQEMSKQRLIQLILSQVVPLIKQFREQSPIELKRLTDELEFERNRLQTSIEKHGAELESVEIRWMQLNKQLENRLEAKESELRQTIESHKNLLNQLESEHAKEMDSLAEGYRQKLADEREQFEETLRRRERFQQLELESKLKVNCDLMKLETVFGEWHKMIENTISQLNVQFKSVDALLDKQAIAINGTNVELASKSKQLLERQECFEHQGAKLSNLADTITEMIPRFVQLQHQSETASVQTCKQVQEFARLHEELQLRQRDLEQSSLELSNQKEMLTKEQFSLGIELNRLAQKEERLNDLIKRAEKGELELAEQKIALKNRETHLEAKSESLEIRTNQAKEEHYELQSARRRIALKEDQLQKLNSDLSNKRKAISKEASKLNFLKTNAHKELAQLNRLQKSLVCSICMDRLCDREQRLSLNKWPPLTKSRPDNKLPINFERELAEISKQIELDGHRLSAEQKYAQHLLMSV